jgi:hypothetical protein
MSNREAICGDAGADTSDSKSHVGADSFAQHILAGNVEVNGRTIVGGLHNAHGLSVRKKGRGKVLFCHVYA